MPEGLRKYKIDQGGYKCLFCLRVAYKQLRFLEAHYERHHANALNEAEAQGMVPAPVEHSPRPEMELDNPYPYAEELFRDPEVESSASEAEDPEETAPASNEPGSAPAHRKSRTPGPVGRWEVFPG